MKKKFLGITGLLLIAIGTLAPMVTAEESFRVDVNLLWSNLEGIVKVGV